MLNPGEAQSGNRNPNPRISTHADSVRNCISTASAACAALASNSPPPNRYNPCVILPACCILVVMWIVDLNLVDAWLSDLDFESYVQGMAAIELLAERGPQLGRPLVDTVVQSRHKNMKELRPGSSGRSELRVLFAFDPQRQAIMLIAGDKAGNWHTWYETNIPVADELFDKHLKTLKGAP
ncbi:type II toxin-antitoxin system RelE/ParE family toxin [Arthrobacter sp. UCD-GKA]|uniref:type II toxin-antitoxin system RelE/ParE family toxin n=1 Tax=Arthrobacter sp. UCD-GKA TaxID=1913576 RepID=UPI0025706969|nr:type II toxin-antitoxin system RelE/ParE family toxin [Arthrobacter sp. UCD-GKA]